MSHLWMSHVAHMNKSWHNIWMSHVTHMNESWRACEWLDVTHMNESYEWCHTYEWVIWTSHMCCCITYVLCHRICVVPLHMCCCITYKQVLLRRVWVSTVVSRIDQCCCTCCVTYRSVLLHMLLHMHHINVLLRYIWISAARVRYEWGLLHI